MSQISLTARRLLAGTAALVIGTGVAFSALAQSAAGGDAPAAKGTPAGRATIDARKAVFTLIAANFRGLGDVAKGAVPYDAAAVQTRISRIVFLADFAGEYFTDPSNIGEPETKAKPDIWANRADFDKKLKDLQSSVATLAQINATEKGATDAYKAAVAAVGQNCKACHDSYKVK